MKQGLQDNIVLDLGDNDFFDGTFNTWGGEILDYKLNEGLKNGTIFDVVIKAKDGNLAYTAPILSWCKTTFHSKPYIYAVIKGLNETEYIMRDITIRI